MISGGSPRDQLVILRLDLHRKIHEHPIPQCGRLREIFSPERIIIQRRRFLTSPWIG